MNWTGALRQPLGLISVSSLEDNRAHTYSTMRSAKPSTWRDFVLLEETRKKQEMEVDAMTVKNGFF